MPIVHAPVPSTGKSVTQNVVFSVLEDLVYMLGLPKPEIIEYTRDTETKALINQNLVTKGDTRIAVAIDEKYSEAGLNTVGVNTTENRAVFADTALDVLLRPIYTDVEINLAMTYITHSKTQAQQWYDHLYVNIAHGREALLHDVTYNYGLPRPFCKLLKQIHEYREKIAPYNESFGRYIKKHGSHRITELTNRKGTVTLLAVAETQARIVGWIADEPIPEVASKEDGTYHVSLMYKFTYQKPIAMSMQYPVIVHQSVLPRQYIELPPPGDEFNNPSFSKSTSAFYKLEQSYELHGKPVAKRDAIVNIPDFDTFYPIYGHSDIIDLVNILVTIDPEDPRMLLNLKDLGDYDLHPPLIEYLQLDNEYKSATMRYKSIVHITVCEGDYRIRHDVVHMDKDLNLRLNYDANLRLPYRVRIGIMSELHYLVKDAWINVRKRPQLFFDLAKCLNSGITEIDLVRELYDKETLTQREIDEVFPILRKYLNGSYLGTDRYNILR